MNSFLFHYHYLYFLLYLHRLFTKIARFHWCNHYISKGHILKNIYVWFEFNIKLYRTSTGIKTEASWKSRTNELLKLFSLTGVKKEIYIRVDPKRRCSVWLLAIEFSCETPPKLTHHNYTRRDLEILSPKNIISIAISMCYKKSRHLYTV